MSWRKLLQSYSFQLAVVEEALDMDIPLNVRRYDKTNVLKAQIQTYWTLRKKPKV
jgi:hypothetical protein